MPRVGGIVALARVREIIIDAATKKASFRHHFAAFGLRAAIDHSFANAAVPSP